VPHPHLEYTKRIEKYQRIVAIKERTHRQIGNSKLAVVGLALMIAFLSLVKHSISAYWIFVPVAFYGALAIWHEMVLRAQRCAESAAVFYRRGVARVEDHWAGTGETGERFRDTKHRYADDLDLFGRGSLFELLSTARLPMGENFLAHWLCSPSPIAAVVNRQKLVAELRENLDLRESIATTGSELRAHLNPESLAFWSEGKTLMPTSLRALVALLSLSAVATLVLSFATLVYWPLLSVLITESLVFWWLQRRAEAVVSHLSANAAELTLLAQILGRLEREPFTSESLQAFRDPLKAGGAASNAIQKLARVVYWIDARDSVIGRFLDVTMLYTILTAFAAEAWRHRWGRRTRLWIDIVGEMEALLSLASYSFEHPQDPFPVFDAEHTEPFFDGEELGHPLIPAQQCVRNSVRLDQSTRLLLISGSNMSGKSTFLRTVGVNAVLARAGAPIRGEALRLSSLALGTRIRSGDSLQEGRSNFYTEILRIRDVFELTTGEQPLLFLFDELLEGTNSKDRRIGAEGLLRALLERNAIGMVTTHDLALTEITETLGEIARNAHYQDFVESGEMRFDYKLRDGVVTRSNALELMRLIGLRV
jgi:MutS-like protein